MSLAGGSWSVEHHTGTAEELHHLEIPARRTLMVMHTTLPALVLGSTQDGSLIDVASLQPAGVHVARRRSGGGAVLLIPGEHIWVDLVLPADDPLWVDDVESSSWWVGAAWTAALAAAPSAAARSAPAAARPAAIAAEVHHGTVTDRRFGRLVCFAAIGPGEVTVGDRKLVGLSQRRTRTAARFQCIVHRRFDPDATVSMLSPPAVPSGLRAALLDGVTDLERCGIDAGWGVVEDLLLQLP